MTKVSIIKTLEKHHFSSIEIEPIESLCSDSFDDICSQNILVAIKKKK
jgi:hypothetical protein